MLDISDESYERVTEAVGEIGCCCDTEDDYRQWEDTAASAIAPYILTLLTRTGCP